MIAAVVVGLLSAELPGSEGLFHVVRAVELPMIEFGNIAGQIGFVIALAAIIGTAMMESGAADKIVGSLMAVFGEGRAAIALIVSSVVLAIPVFFDTVFFLLIPLGQAFYHRTGKHYLFFVMAIAGGAALTHHLVPPTPGPLIMAETLNIDLGLTILAGLGAALLPAVAVYYIGQRIDARLQLPFRAPIHAPEEERSTEASAGYDPGLSLSLLPVMLPVLLISLATIFNLADNDESSNGLAFINFVGNKNVAMFIGTAIALWLWARRKGWKISDLGDAVSEPLQIAGIIILITCAGGAFGAMIRHAGIGEAVEWATSSFHVNYIILAWLIAAIMKVAQGSGTVSMITTASIMAAIVGDGSALPYHPMYVLLSIGFGAMFISWMNDSGFWVVAKLGGFTERETLQSWTVLLGLLGLIGLVQLLVLSAVLPFNG
jgi:GntP family gluconate:H+ symporter